MIKKRSTLPPANPFLNLSRKKKKKKKDWLITLSYQIFKELVKWNKECRQTKMNKLHFIPKKQPLFICIVHRSPLNSKIQKNTAYSMTLLMLLIDLLIQYISQKNNPTAYFFGKLHCCQNFLQ